MQDTHTLTNLSRTQNSLLTSIPVSWFVFNFFLHLIFLSSVWDSSYLKPGHSPPLLAGWGGVAPVGPKEQGVLRLGQLSSLGWGPSRGEDLLWRSCRGCWGTRLDCSAGCWGHPGAAAPWNTSVACTCKYTCKHTHTHSELRCCVHPSSSQRT